MIRSKDAIDLFPRFIAKKYQQLTNCREPGMQTCQAALAVLDRCLRLVAIYCTSQYLRRDRESFRSSELNKMMDPKSKTSDLRVGNLNNLFNIIVTTLKAYQGNRDRFVIPEMYDLYWDTSNPRKHIVKQAFWSAIQQVLPYANDLNSKVHLPTSESGWKSMTDECVGVVQSLIEELSFLKEYTLLQITDRNGIEYTASVYQGLDVKEGVKFNYPDVLGIGGIYFSKKDRTSFLRLDPLIQETSTKADAVYRELTRYAKLQYLLLTSEDPVEEDDDNLVEEFFNLLVTIENVKRNPSTEEQINWDELQAAAQEQNRVSASTLRKVDQSLYLQRDKILSLFTDFLNTDTTCFVLTGRSGAGKSSFALSILEVEEITSNPSICPILISAPALRQDLDLDQAITESLYRCGNKNFIPGKKTIWDLLSSIANIEDDKRVLLILDAVNEHSRPLQVFEQIFKLLKNRYKWLKVMVTSRPETLELLGKNYNIDSEDDNLFYRSAVDENPENSFNLPLAACEVLPFNSEELPQVYRKYQAHYELKTDIEELEKNFPEVVELIKDPFYLSLLARKNKGKIISEHINQFTLIHKFIEDLRQSDIKKDRAFMRRDIDFVKKELVPLFFPDKDKLVPQPFIEPLFTTSQYRDDLKNEGIYSSLEFVNPILRLSQINIIRRSEDGTGTRIAFQHDKFLEYFLGEYLFNQMSNWFNGDVTQGYRELIAGHLIEMASFMGILQHCLYRHLQEGEDNQGKLQIDFNRLCVSSNPSVKLVVVPVLAAFYAESRKSREIVDRIITMLAHTPITHEVRRDRDALNAVLSARETALETAYHVVNTSKIVDALLDRNSEVRELGIRYTYLLDRVQAQKSSEASQTGQEPSMPKSIEILCQMSEQMSGRFFHYRHCFSSFAQLSMVLLIEHMDEEFEEDHPSPLIDIVLGTIRKIGRFGNKKKTFLDQAFQMVLMTLMLNFITSMLKFWVRFRRKKAAAWENFKQEEYEEQPDRRSIQERTGNFFTRLFLNPIEKKEVGNTSANYNEFASYYRLPPEKRVTAKELCRFMDLENLRKDYITAEKTLLEGFSNANCMTTTFGNAIASAWGATESHRISDLCEKIYSCDQGHWEVGLDASIIWYQAVKRQKYRDEDREKWDAWLKTGKDMIRTTLIEGGKELGYGRFETSIGTYEQYPLLFYMALYNRIYPGSPNDLLDEFLERAKGMSPAERERLLIYLADTLGDRRAYLTNYPPVLNSLEAYIPKEKESQSYIHVSDEFVAHLAASFAGIRGVYPHQMDHFLMSIGARKAFTDQVVQMSYERQSTVISLRAADFVYDLLIHGDEKMRAILVQIAHYMTHERSFEDALRKIGFYLVKKLNEGG
jgi:hypothetical protein